MKKLLLLQVLFGVVTAFAGDLAGACGSAYDLLVLPFYRQWGATFCLISGTSEHPREVVGLEYSASPME